MVQTFLGVVSDLLAITSNQNLTPTQKNGNGDKNPGTSLLITLDKFALRSFDASLGVITDNNISKLCPLVYGYSVYTCTYNHALYKSKNIFIKMLRLYIGMNALRCRTLGVI